MSSFLLYGGLAYWVACAALFFGSLFLHCPDEDVQRKGKLLAEMSSPRREIALVLSGLLVFFFSPILTPCLIVWMLLDHRRQVANFRSIRRTYYEKVFERLHPVNLPPLAARHFDEHSPTLMALGFQDLGSYLLKPEPVASYGRCFISPDGRSLGILGNMFDDTYYSFSTLFKNGISLDTAATEEFPRIANINQSKNFRAAFCPGVALEAAYARHLEEIENIETSHATSALSFSPDQFRDVLIYEDRVFHQWLYEQGELDAPPPLACLPAASADEIAAPPAISDLAVVPEKWNPSDHGAVTTTAAAVPVAL